MLKESILLKRKNRLIYMINILICRINGMKYSVSYLKK